MRLHHKQLNRGGYTLIEAVVVVTLIGLLAALVAPNISGTIARSRIEGLIAELASDAQYARSLALRSGNTVTVCVLPQAYVLYAGYVTDAQCDAPPASATPVKRVDLRRDYGAVQLRAEKDVNPWPSREPIKGFRFNSQGAISPHHHIFFHATRGTLHSEFEMNEFGRMGKDF